MINHYDPGNVARTFDAVVHPRDMAYQQGDQNTEADRPRTGLKYLTERSAAGSPHGRGLRVSAERSQIESGIFPSTS
jgi:hypothetical protein